MNGHGKAGVVAAKQSAERREICFMLFDHYFSLAQWVNGFL
jgi:hypothetical protein